MQIRAGQPEDLERLIDLDGTIESAEYLHVERAGEGLAMEWRLEERPLREKRVDSNAVDEDRRFAIRQVLGGVRRGSCWSAEHDDQLVALAVARLDAGAADARRDRPAGRLRLPPAGAGIAMIYQIINDAREHGPAGGDRDDADEQHHRRASSCRRRVRPVRGGHAFREQS